MANGSLQKIQCLDMAKAIYADQGGNLNDIKSPGIYYVGQGVPNAPDNWGMLTVLANTSGLVIQQFCTGWEFYFRGFLGSPPSWSTWRRSERTNVT